MPRIDLPNLDGWIKGLITFQNPETWLPTYYQLSKALFGALDTYQSEGLGELWKDHIHDQRHVDSISQYILTDKLFIPEFKEGKRMLLNYWTDTMSNFFCSLLNPGSSYQLSIASDGKQVQYYFLESDQTGKVEKNISSFFPGISHKKTGGRIFHGGDKQIFIGGIPTPHGNNDFFLPIDRLISGLYGKTFALDFFIDTVEEEVIRLINKGIEGYLDDLQILNNLAFSSSTGPQNRWNLNAKYDRASGNRLIKLIQKDVERLKVGLQKGMWSTRIKFSTEEEETLSIGEAVIKSIYGGKDSSPMRVKTARESFISLLTSKELSTYFCFPTKEAPGITLKPIHFFGTNQDSASNHNLSLGDILYQMNASGKQAALDLNSLTKHALICGITGSGKTTTVKKILSGLLHKNVPFLVIEPVKSEYRIEGVDYIDVGKDNFSINLFQPATKRTPIIAHIDYLRAVFGASFVLYPPMPYVLESAIYEVYETLIFRFDDLDIKCKNYPTIDFLILIIEEVVKKSGYSEKLKDDILAALKIRLKNLLKGYKGKVFNAYKTYPDFSELLKKPTVLNLNRIVDDEQKALLISIILVNLYEYWESQGSKGELQHVTVIEEAHRLLAKTTSIDGNPDAANPKAKAVEFFANMLSEIRAYGEGLIIAEQIPTKLIPDVIKNTGTKIVHKLVAFDDRMTMGQSMNFEPDQENFLTILQPGQAVMFNENTVKPIIIQVK
jgi:DNA helicase HerA-like ATPase